MPHDGGPVQAGVPFGVGLLQQGVRALGPPPPDGGGVQEVQRPDAPAARGVMEGGLPVGCVGRRQVAPLLQQEFERGEVAGPCSEEQRRLAVGVAKVDERDWRPPAGGDGQRAARLLEKEGGDVGPLRQGRVVEGGVALSGMGGVIELY